MTEVLIAAKTKSSNVGLKVIQCAEMHEATGVEFINAPECSAEYSEMTADELKRIVTETKAAEQYNDIIIDMNSGYNDSIFKVLEVCDLIIMPYRNNKVSYNKMEDFADELLKLKKLAIIGNRIIPIENCSNSVNRENFGEIYVKSSVPEIAALANIDNILYSDCSLAANRILSVLY